MAIGITDNEGVAVVVGIQDALRGGGGEVIRITPSRDISIAEDIATAVGIYVRIVGVIVLPEHLVVKLGVVAESGRGSLCPAQEDVTDIRAGKDTIQIKCRTIGRAPIRTKLFLNITTCPCNRCQHHTSATHFLLAAHWHPKKRPDL